MKRNPLAWRKHRLLIRFGRRARFGAFFLSSAFLLLSARPSFATALQVLHSFSIVGYSPGPLVVDSAGNLFGTTFDGGDDEVGTVYELSNSGSDGYSLKVLHSFRASTDGSNPLGDLTFDNLGNIFGTTSGDGPILPGTTGSAGTVFELQRQDNGAFEFHVLHTFSTSSDALQNTDGLQPSGPLVLGSDGSLYGTTSAGGNGGRGTIFRLNRSATGATLTAIFSFGASGTCRFLSADRDGNLYGTFSSAGAASLGSIFELVKSGTGYTLVTLYEFSSESQAMNPSDGVILDSGGDLIGTAQGGTRGLGAVFALQKSSSGAYSFTLLHSFLGMNEGQHPLTRLVRSADGALFGLTLRDPSLPSSKGALFKLVRGGDGRYAYSASYPIPADVSLSSQYSPAPITNHCVLAIGELGEIPDAGSPVRTLCENGSSLQADTILTCPYSTEGDNPGGSILRHPDGSIVLTTLRGGRYGYGTIISFSKTAEGYQTKILHSFAGQPKGDGAMPSGNLAEDGSGIIYGTTMNGGTFNNGTIFELRPSVPGHYAYSVLVSFSESNDGGFPAGGIVVDNSGHIYGTTQYGGTFGRGTVFRFSLASNQLALLHSFSGNDDGQQPMATVVRDNNGNLFGTTAYGGDEGEHGTGTVFRISNAGDFTTLYSFPAYAGPGVPNAPLLIDSQGNLYGSTTFGNPGLIFKLTRSDNDYHFDSLLSLSDQEKGDAPYAPLIQDSNGNLFGTAARGGLPGAGAGTVFELTSQGGSYSIIALHKFAKAFDGELPLTGIVKDPSGDFYGTTNSGGVGNGGTIFRIVNDRPEISLFPTSLPPGLQYVPYPPVQFTASGGAEPFVFSDSESRGLLVLPDEMTFSASGLLSGTPSRRDSFDVPISVIDAEGFESGANYSLEIGPGPTPAPPVALPLAISTFQRGVHLQLLATDPTGVAGDSMTFVFDSYPSHGHLFSLDDGPVGDLNYGADPGFYGTDEFAFRAQDRFGTSEPAVVTITILDPAVVTQRLTDALKHLILHLP